MGKIINTTGYLLSNNLYWNSSWYAESLNHKRLCYQDIKVQDYLRTTMTIENNSVLSGKVRISRDVHSLDIFMPVLENIRPEVHRSLRKIHNFLYRTSCRLYNHHLLLATHGLQNTSMYRGRISDIALYQKYREASEVLVSKYFLFFKKRGYDVENYIGRGIVDKFVKQSAIDRIADTCDLYTKSISNIHILTTTHYDAQIIAQIVASQVEKRITFGKIVKKLKKNYKSFHNITGIRIQCTGRPFGNEMAFVKWFKLGKIPVHSFNTHIDYAQRELFNRYGACTIKVWINTDQ